MTQEMDMLNQISNKLDKLSDTVTKNGEQLHRVSLKTDDVYRGMYGDERNKTEGLISRQIRDERRLKSLEDTKVKLTAYVVGGVVVIQALIWVFQNFVFRAS